MSSHYLIVTNLSEMSQSVHFFGIKHVYQSACNFGFNLSVFFARLQISSLLDSTDIRTSSFAPPLVMKSLALSSANGSS